MSNNAKLTYLFLVDYVGEAGSCFPGQQRLALVRPQLIEHDHQTQHRRRRLAFVPLPPGPGIGIDAGELGTLAWGEPVPSLLPATP